MSSGLHTRTAPQAPARAGAESERSRPPHPRAALFALAVVAAGVVNLSAGAAGPPETSSVGRGLSLRSAAVMEPVNAPARISRVAVTPGHADAEVWGIGFSHAQKPGWDRVTVEGQTIFARYTRSTGWQVVGPPLDEEGRPAIAQLAAIAMAPNGEGWSVGGFGRMYHRAPGGPWVLDAEASRLTSRTLLAVSLGMDDRGVYGWAVGVNFTFLRLQDGRWSLDVQGGQVPTVGGAVPDLISVAAVDRDRAWAVGSGNALMIMRRTREGWTRTLTGRPMFDSPPAPIPDSGGTGTVNQFARGSAVAATLEGAWVTGAMQPVDATKPTGDGSAADRTRPFALWFDHDRQEWISYCPRIHQLSDSGLESTVEPCDRPFPFATGDLPALVTFSGGGAVAGGFGLFRFADGAWRREPNALGYLVSAAFRSPEEGWVTTPGNVLAGGGLAFTSTITLGRVASAPLPARVRRWAQPATEHLESVAVEPGGSGAALAVGGRGTVLRHEPGVGWDLVPSPTEATLHRVAWSAPRLAHMVGADGTILRFDGRELSVDPASGRATRNRLLGVAFAGAGRGYAVGDKGTILRYTDGRWSPDPASGRVTDKRLSAVAFAGGQAVAVGDAGTILVEEQGAWRVQEGTGDLLRSGQEGLVPNLLSVAGLPDGRAYIGGARAVLLERSPGQAFRHSSLPALDGAIHTIAASQEDGRMRLVVAVGESRSRYSGPGIVDPAGWLFAGDERGWRDLGTRRPIASTPELDAPAQRDPVYGVALDGDGRGWAVGGLPAEVPDDEGHLRVTPSSSIWRFDADRIPPASPAEATAELHIPPGTVGFAFIADTACATGLCAGVLGSGARADTVLLSAGADIARVARRGTVRFVMAGGDLRRNGLPDELEPVRRFFDDVSVPVFAAMGDKDLFAGPGPSAGESGGVLASAGYYQRVFMGRPAPWGWGPPSRGIIPVELGERVEADRSLARTHYAFDVAPGGRAVLRIVVLDTSRTPLATSSQNPPREQTGWLQTVLADAAAKDLPTVVAMHRPLVVPVTASADASSLTAVLATGGVSAVLAGHQRTNRLVMSPAPDVPEAFPVGIFGSGGSPLEREWRPDRGSYHAWQLVSVNVDPAALSVLGRAPVSIRSIPVLESVALSAPDGRSVAAGGTLRFRGLGRLPDVGGPHTLGRSPDLDASRSTYLHFPFPRRCAPLESPEGGCVAPDVVLPDHAFSCEDPSVCAFVAEDPTEPGTPLRDAEGRLVPDEHSGLLCALRPGSTAVLFEAGTRATRVPVTVAGGGGPCIPGTLAAPPDPFAPPTRAETLEAAEGSQPPADQTPTHLLRPRVPEVAAIAAVAPPAVNTAPAPPAGGGGQREEQREAATEQAEMTALRYQRSNEAPGPGEGLAVLFGAAGLAALGALAVRDRRRHRAAASYIGQTTRRN